MRNYLQRFAYLLGTMLCICLGVICFNSTQEDRAAYLDEQGKAVEIQKGISEYEARLSRLKQEHQVLTNKPEYFERLAREQFGMVRSDELVFLLDR